MSQINNSYLEKVDKAMLWIWQRAAGIVSTIFHKSAVTFSQNINLILKC